MAVFTVRGPGMNEIPAGPVCLVLLTAGLCVASCSPSTAPGVWGLLYLLVSRVSAGENVDCICSFIQEIFIEIAVMNRANKFPAVMELYY